MAEDLQRGENPKQKFGQKKIQVGLFPPSALLYGALAMQDGAKKYGPYNFRETHVITSTYYHAAMRHLTAWWDREEKAEDSKLPHLAHALACIAIIIDTLECGTAVDDRPPAGMSSTIQKRWTVPDEPKE